jgi:hypothetical protein
MAWHISNKLYEKWRSSQAQEVASLAERSSDGNASVQSSGSPIPLLYLPPDRMKAFSRLSRSGMTFKPLTEDRGAALLTWYLAGFPAKTSAAAGKGAGIEGERSGMWKHMARIIGEVRPRYVLVENSPILTSRGLELFSGTWPRWGTMRNGECTAQPTSEIATCENDFGFALVTPTASDHKRANLSSPCWQKRKNGGVRKAPGTLPEQLAWMGFAGMLAPTLPEKMLCFPNGWTDLRPLATLSIAEWCALHGIPYTNGCQSA